MSTKSTKIVGTNLRKVRQSKHLTQLEVAQKAGVSVNYYARIERGEVAQSIEILELIVEALGIKSSAVLPF